ncbi:MAG: hypothetical protein ACJAU1_000528 [Psychromonas sp.]|jgi:hypothetical protein
MKALPLHITFLLYFGFIINTVMILLILYLVKSVLNINLLENFSFGVWDWFKSNILILHQAF